MINEVEVLAEQLVERELKIVFAESCTAGLASALLAAVPGISRYHCGSLVTYREASKQAWLGVEAGLLAEFTAVSPQVTRAMALGALRVTEEADVAVAITGHLGPDASPALDGACFAAIAVRSAHEPAQREHHLRLSPTDRVARQRAAATALLSLASQWIREIGIGC